MQERTLNLNTAAGTMEVFIAHPGGKGPFPPVVLYMDRWGIREELRDLARRIATSGYYCILPDLYYRWGKVRNSFKKTSRGRCCLSPTLPRINRSFFWGRCASLVIPW